MAKPSSTPKIATKKHVARLERERRQVAIIRTGSTILIAFVILLVGYAIFHDSYLKYRESVAEVNGEKITLGYWQERIQFTRANLVNSLQQYQFYQQNFGMDTSQQQQRIQSLLQSPETLGDQVLNQLIDEILIREEAQKRGITVTKAEIEEKIQEGLHYYPNGTPIPTITPTEVKLPTLTTQQLTLYPATSTPTEVLTETPAPTDTPNPASTATLVPTLTSTPGPASPTPLPLPATATATPYTASGYKDQYKKSLDSLKGLGISEATFRSIYEFQLYREKLLIEIAKDTPRTETKALVRHILVDDSKLADKLYSQLVRGEDFAQLAKLNSKDKASAVNGGNMEWFGKGAMVPEFEKAAFSQKIGEIGKPVKSQYGYHIIQVIARQDIPASASEYEQLRQTAFTDWLKKAHDDAKTAGKVKTFDIWKTNIPPMPAALAPQQPQQPQQQ